MYAVIIAAALCAAPATKTERLAVYIIKTEPRAAPYAVRLAVAIFAEAQRFKLDPAYFAAIAHTESHFRTTARGQWYERGIWQLWPWARWHRQSWVDLIRRRPGLTGFTVVDWAKMPRKAKVRAATDIGIGTYMAAHLLAHHVHKCRRARAYCYAKYNRPAAPRRGYMWTIRRRAKAIRRALAGK